MGAPAGRVRADAQCQDSRSHAVCWHSGAVCRWALLRNMVTDLIKHERIQTTVAKAKEVSANARGCPALRVGLGPPAAANVLQCALRMPLR